MNDYAGKFKSYRRLSSLEEYVLISQHQALVETFRKAPNNEWVLHADEGLNATVTINCIGVSVPLREAYEGVAMSAGGE